MLLLLLLLLSVLQVQTGRRHLSVPAAAIYCLNDPSDVQKPCKITSGLVIFQTTQIRLHNISEKV
eukprot:SAG22_NODE_43_length_25304_cov_5.394644_7_plen_65_part_00